MGFIPISINDYIKKHLKNKNELEGRLNAALADYKKGVKYLYSNDIWVIGSASNLRYPKIKMHHKKNDASYTNIVHNISANTINPKSLQHFHQYYLMLRVTSMVY